MRAQYTSAATLLGRSIRDVEGTPVGHVEDLLIDGTSGYVAYVRCRLNDNGDGQLSVTVPRSAVQVANDAREAVLIIVREDALRKLAADV